MSERDERWLRALATVRDAGPLLEARWDPQSREGFVYVRGDDLADEELRSSLEDLARFGYVERTFVDRLSLCPNCRSHAINVREICLSCKSSNLTSVETLHHYRCGFVGPSYAFALDDEGRRCPKCGRTLHDLGTDFDSPGTSFVCRVCDSKFQLPDVGALCLSCGQTLAGDEMRRIVYREAFSYRLSRLGAAALQSGRLLDRDGETRYENGAHVFRRSVVLAMLEDERKRSRRFGTPYSVIVIAVKSEAHEMALAPRLLELVGETDKLGRLDARHYLLLMPSVSSAQAKATLKQILNHPSQEVRDAIVRAAMVELGDASNTVERLAEATRWIDRQ